MKRRSKEDEYFVKKLEAEIQYLHATSGGKCIEPFVTPLLFRLLDTLRMISFLLSCIFGLLLFRA